MIIAIVGAMLFEQGRHDLRRGVASFNIRRTDSPRYYWCLILAKLLFSIAMLLYALVLWQIARGRIAPLGFLGL